MTENEVFEHISDLAGDYKCFDEKISHQESLILCNLIKEIQQYRAIGTVEEFKALKATNVEIEIPEPQGNEIVAGIMIPKVKGKAVVSLSDLHDILMDVGGTNIRDKVFEQIYNRDIIIGLRDVIEKWEERRKYESNKYR